MAAPPSNTFIVGIGSARMAPRRDDVNTTELAWEAVKSALADAGVELPEITGAVTASQDFWEGRTISSMAVNEIAGGTLGSEAKVAADGVLALLYATARIDDGDQALNLVVAHSKESQAEPHAIELAAFDPYFQRPLGPNERVAAALQAGLFYGSRDFGPEDSARVVAAARRHSDALDPVSVEDVLSSPSLSTPLRELERAGYMDAATALVVCDGETAKRLGKPAVAVPAGAARAGAFWTDRDLTRAPEAADAAAAALDAAGWDRDTLDRIEITTPFAHQHLLLGSELGFGDGDELVARFEGQGDGPALNPSGGWLAGGAGTVAGLAAVAHAASDLRSSGGRALVQAATGICHQSHGVVLLEGVR